MRVPEKRVVAFLRHTTAALLAAVLCARSPAAAQDRAAGIEQLVALARQALASRQLARANQLAEDAYGLAVASLEESPTAESRIRIALGAAIETRADVMVADGARAEAARFLKLEVARARGTSLAAGLAALLGRTSLEGRPAPPISGGMRAGARVPAMAQLKGKVVLLYFWAHWCGQCRADAPMVDQLLQEYRGRGLVIVAPTRRYGYIDDGRPVSPATELRHIQQVRDTHYRFLRNEPVPIGDDNYRDYGVTTIPMYVLLDRDGVVRLYRAGRMTPGELEAEIRRLL